MKTKQAVELLNGKYIDKGPHGMFNSYSHKPLYVAPSIKRKELPKRSNLYVRNFSDATDAMYKMNGGFLDNRKLYVAFAQKKEERQKTLSQKVRGPSFLLFPIVYENKY